ncbi:hypothetical protein AB0D86_43875 [Streptomyces sp. NPDC048324]
MNFDDRMYLGSQAVYEAICRGEVQDVEAALLDAQLKASEADDA